MIILCEFLNKQKTNVFTADEAFVSYMQSYLLREDQLKSHGYPRPTRDPGVASIVRKPDEVYDVQPVGSNGMNVYDIKDVLVFQIKSIHWS